MQGVPRLSGKEMLILRLLVGSGEAYGLDLVRRSDGELKRGTVYVTLHRMEEKGYVESRREEGGELARRLYRASGLGARVLAAWEMAGGQLGWGAA